MERRTLPTEFEVRQEGSQTIFEGYALKWRKMSQDLGGFREEVAEGATTETIRDDDIRALFNHDPNLILGRNRAGTLRLAEDTMGLHYQVVPSEATYARDLIIAMERGDVTQSSFGFRVVRQSWSENVDTDELLRTLESISLFDVSPVTYPAYLDSTSGVGTRAFKPSELDEIRASLRDEPVPVESFQVTESGIYLRK
jgi:uncharacterized protein